MPPLQPLPAGRITELLGQKAAARTDISVDLSARLGDLRDRIAAEARYIVALFPEYTPHDDQHHLEPLFKIAEMLIGREQLGQLNATELFILSCGMYAHDWGMAVSETEKAFITRGVTPAGPDAPALWCLPNERERFARFVREQLGAGGAADAGEEVGLPLWREYVRQTHAFRSGERVRHFLQPFDGGLAEAVAKLCVSHWLDVEDLDDYKSYPPDYSVLRETVNLRALAIYLRLADLFDLAEDRTPYVIWKYVAPRDPRSKLEWAKHRAVHSVTVHPYRDGRVIQIDGTTDDVEVYAALKDLEALCDRELRACVHLLGRTNDPRHALDIFNAEWRIAPRGFKPMAIRFDFDRERMFQILGDEIYGGDSYVFLRELLQNSIDAIRMRREVLQRQGLDARGTIRVDVTEDADKNMVVRLADDGIGMDEYIVRNYLATAGRSYYQSDDFRKINLQLDPISRFGIGLLSCFAVAERIHIDTRREPYMGGQSESLSIDVPAFNRYFRIEASGADTMPVGTAVTVYVDRRKLPADDAGRPVELDVTDYLRRVAGFVEFPIVVTTPRGCTVITSPETEAARAAVRADATCEHVSLPLRYPVGAVAVDSTGTASPPLEEESYDLAGDLGMSGFAGKLIFLRLAESVGDLVKSGYESRVEPFLPVDSSGEPLPQFEVLRIYEMAQNYYGQSILDALEEMKIPLEESFPDVLMQSLQSPSRSAWASPFYRVYRDGVLLSSVSPPLSFQTFMGRNRLLPAPCIIANLPKSVAPRVDLARSRILDTEESWDAPVVRAFRTYLSEKRLPALLGMPPADRLRELARWNVNYRLSADALWEMLPRDKWPVAFLDKGGRITVKEWAEIKDEVIVVLDERIKRTSKRLVSAFYGDAGKFPRLPDECLPVALYSADDLTDSSDDPVLAAAWCDLSFRPLRESHVVAGLITTPADMSAEKPNLPDYTPVEILTNFLLVQKVLRPRKSMQTGGDLAGILAKATTSPAELEPEELALLSQSIKHWPTAVSFPAAIGDKFAFGGILNLRHPATPVLLKLIAHVEAERRRTPGGVDKYRTIRFLLKNLDLGGSYINADRFRRNLSEVRSLAVSQGLPVGDWPSSLVVSDAEIEGTSSYLSRL